MNRKLMVFMTSAVCATVLGSNVYGFGGKTANINGANAAPAALNAGILQPATAVRQTKRSVRSAPVFTPEKGISGVQTYIVQLNEKPAATYAGGIQGLAATSPQYLRKNNRSMSQKLNVKSSTTKAYTDYLKRRHNEVLGAATRKVGGGLEIKRQYVLALNGFTVDMTPEQAARMAELGGIKRITRNVSHPLHTDAGPSWIGAPAVWDGSANGTTGTYGEGVVVGIMDTGINGDHPSFAATGSDGFTVQNPLGENNYMGECFSSPEIVCNSKLIGRWDFTNSGDSEDVDGHGSHTASTSAGNFQAGVPMVDADGTPIDYTLGGFSGVAPHANIIAYRVCPANTCPTDAVIAATERGIADGVDVLNHSIGSAAGTPWGDPKSEAFKAARAAGIALANSAGNSGTDPGTVNGTGSAPWTTSVAASTHDRGFPIKDISFSGPAGAPAAVSGRSITQGITAPLVYAGDYENPNSAADPAQCLDPFPAGTFDGQIVMCDRGAIARVDKGKFVRDGGAGGFILCNVEGGAAFLSDDAHVIPGIHITAQDCAGVKDWMQTGTDHVATIDATGPPIRDPDLADVMAGFSSRGPYPGMEYLSPMITAPGVNIFAAYADPTDYISISGTSMSSPHIAGSFALLKSAHPDWTPAEINSAVMMTADDNVREDEDPNVFDGPLVPADAFDTGAGSVRVNQAVAIGLVLDETDEDFTAADPATGGDPRQLNIASLYNTECLGSCSFTRTFRAVRGGTWTLAANNGGGVGVSMEPASFTVAEGDMQEVTFSADVNALETNQWYFSRATLQEASSNSPDAVLPLVVQTAAAIFPDKLTLMADRDQGSMIAGGIRTAEIDGLEVTAFGLATPEDRDIQISGSVGDFTPYTGESTQIEFFNVPAGSVQMIAETIASTAPDADMFVGRDINEDREITVDEELCQSGNADSIESCTLTAEQLEGGGIFWVAVFNFEGSGDDIVDTTELKVSVISPTVDGSIYAQVPSQVSGGEPFDVRVFWDKEMEVGASYIGAVELTAPNGSLGLIPVEINRAEDDIKLLADSTSANVGDEVGMTVEISPNLSPEDRFYVVSAPIPEGTALVPGSITGGGQSFVINNQVIWTADLPSLTRIGRTYQPTINGPGVDSNHPLYDATCDSGFGGYVDLGEFGFDLDPEISGNNVSFGAHAEQSVYFYGAEMASGIKFTDDGFLYFGSGVGDNPGNNTTIPDPALPNGIAAVLWNDMEIVYDEADGSGVTLADGGANLSVIEFDNMQPAPAGSTSDRIDFVALVSGRLNDLPNEYELIYAYDNIQGDWGDVTIGVENIDGSYGTHFDSELSDGLVVCWDYQEQPRTPTKLTYTVEVLSSASNSDVEASVFSIVDMPGSIETQETTVISVASADSDGDGIADHLDNCAMTANAEQVDADGDGFGNMCDADFNQDLVVNYLDVTIMMDQFGSADEVVDLNTDGTVDFGDIEVFKTMWLRSPGPSGQR